MIDFAKRALERITLKRDYHTVFTTPEGQHVLSHLLEVSGATRPKFTLDPNEMLWNEAQRHFALSIYRQVHGSTDQLTTHITEQLRKQEEETST